MPVLELVTSSGLGSLLGMRHALEPDHLAAVTTLVTGERSGYKAAFLGVCWGLGHTFALIAAGTVLVILRAEMPVRAADTFEFCVALMLIGLGLRAIYLAARQGAAGPAHVHHHGHTRTCTRVRPHTPAWQWTLARRPPLSARSTARRRGALTALVLATLPTTRRRG
jgi:high-affinity nickel-transport protein